jgi:capsular polysaccharide biosynthesis protein
MRPNDDIPTILRYALGVVFLVVIVATAVYAISSAGAKVYTADSRLVVTAGLGLDPTGGDVLTAPRIAQTYGTLARTGPVLRDVITQVGLPYSPTELDLHLRVTTDPNTPFIIIEVTDESPTRAEGIANAFADILAAKATIPATATDPKQTILEIVERAVVPDEPSGPRVLLNTLLAAAATLVLALVAVSAVAYLRADWLDKRASGG